MCVCVAYLDQNPQSQGTFTYLGIEMAEFIVEYLEEHTLPSSLYGTRERERERERALRGLVFGARIDVALSLIDSVVICVA
jgi:hypothetical protein